jgi:hypothetical protein
VNHVPEREAEQPRHVPGGLPGGHERRGAEGEFLAAQADAAGAGRLDVLVPVGLAPEVQADQHGVPGAERAHRGVAHGAGLAPGMLQVGEGSVAGQAQGHGVDRAARASRERPRERHRLPPPWRGLLSGA